MSSLSASSHVCGNITLDGQPRKSWASRLVAYVPQFDFLLPTLTVAETLRYSALLRLPRDAQGHEVQVWERSLFSCRMYSALMLGPEILTRLGTNSQKLGTMKAKVVLILGDNRSQRSLYCHAVG